MYFPDWSIYFRKRLWLWSPLILLCPTCFSSQLSVAVLIYSNVSVYRRQMSDQSLPDHMSEICFILKSVRGKTLLDKRSCAHLWRFCWEGMSAAKMWKRGAWTFQILKHKAFLHFFRSASHYCSVPSYAGNQRKTSLLRTWHSTILTWLDTDGNRNGLLQWGKFHINALQSVHKGFKHQLETWHDFTKRENWDFTHESSFILSPAEHFFCPCILFLRLKAGLELFHGLCM